MATKVIFGSSDSTDALLTGHRPDVDPAMGPSTYEAESPESPGRARKGDLGMKGKPPPRSSFEHGSDYRPFTLKGR